MIREEKDTGLTLRGRLVTLSLDNETQNRSAGMAELVDAQDSKSCDRKVMRVRFSLPAP